MNRRARALWISTLLLACSGCGDSAASVAEGGAGGAGATAGGSGQPTGAGAQGAAGKSSAGSSGTPGAGVGGTQSGAGATSGGAGASGGGGAGIGGGGTDGPAIPSCRTAADCMGQGACLLPGTVVRACRGIACEADIEPPCTTSADCTAPEVCHVLISLRCGADLYRTCGAPCTSDVDCRDERCGDDGQCRPRSHCSFGAVCPTQTRCEEGPESDFVGCAHNTCAADEDCIGGGHCIGERCYNQLGTCAIRDMAPCLAP
jgi:hypothetical protein